MAYIKPEPKLREKTHVEIRSSITNVIDKNLQNSIGHPFKNCLNCTHWSLSKDWCDKYKTKPPTDILIYACPSHDDDEDIPF